IPQSGVDPLEAGGARRGGAGAGLDDLMGASGLGHSPEAGQAITDNLAGRIEAALGENRNRVIAEADAPAQLRLHRLALGRGFDGGDERGLAGCATAPLAAGALATEVGVVPFNPPAELLAGVALHHRLRQLVLDLPGGGLGHAEAGRPSSMLEMPCLLWVR